MYCFRFFSSNQRLSSIRSLFELFSEIIRAVSGCSAVNKDCPRFGLFDLFSEIIRVVSGCSTVNKDCLRCSRCLSCPAANCTCFRFLGSQLKQSSIRSLFELSSEMYLMHCFRFLCSQQRLSSIRSLYELSSEIIRVVLVTSAVN